jgi:hypothetical protein
VRSEVWARREETLKYEGEIGRLERRSHVVN